LLDCLGMAAGPEFNTAMAISAATEFSSIGRWHLLPSLFDQSTVLGNPAL
jgi:hypothetical protein